MLCLHDQQEASAGAMQNSRTVLMQDNRMTTSTLAHNACMTDMQRWQHRMHTGTLCEDRRITASTMKCCACMTNMQCRQQRMHTAALCQCMHACMQVWQYVTAWVDRQ
jgi:hypothetical protein